MPLLLGPSIALVLGCVIALGLGADVPWSPRLRATVLSFAGAAVVPVFAYFAFRNPAWSLGYFVDDARLPSAVLLVLSLAIAAAMAASVSFFHRWVARGRARDVLLVLAAATVSALGLAVGLRDRFATVATYRGFRGNVETTSLWTSSVGFSAVVGMAVLGAGAWLVLRSAVGDDETPPPEFELRVKKPSPRERRLGRSEP